MRKLVKFPYSNTINDTMILAQSCVCLRKCREGEGIIGPPKGTSPEGGVATLPTTPTGLGKGSGC